MHAKPRLRALWAAALLCAAAAAVATTVTGKGYTITVPSTWKVNQTGTMGTDMVAMAPPTHGFGSNINVTIQDAPPGTTTADLYRQVTQMMPRVLTGWKTLAHATTRADGAPALAVVGTYRMGTPARALAARQLIAIHSGKVYVFTGTTTVAERKSYDPLFLIAFKTIRWAQ